MPAASAARPAPGAATLVGVLSVLGLLSYPLPAAWLGVVGLLGLGAARWWCRGRPLPTSPFALPLGLYAAGAVVGLATAVRPEMAEIRFFGLLAALGAFYLVVDRIGSAGAGRRVVWVALAVVVLAAPLLLVLIAPFLRADRFPGPLAVLGGFIAGLIGPFEAVRDPFFEPIGVGQRYRFSSAGLGALATFGLSLALGPLLAGPSRRARLLGLLASGYFGLLLILSSNRMAMLTAALVPVALLALRYRWAFVSLLVGLLLVVGALALPRAAIGGQLALPPFLPRAATDLGPLHERLELWQNYLFLAEDFRFSGIGLGLRSVSEVYQQRFLPVDPGFNHAHNMFIQTYVEQGLLGLAGLLGLVGVGLVVGARALRRATDPATRMTAISASAAALTLILDGLTEVVALTTLGMVFLFATLALVLVAERLATGALRPRAARRPTLAPRARLAARGAAALLIALGLAWAPATALAGGEVGGLLVGPLQPLRGLAAQARLNLGALELASATIDENSRRGGRKGHLARAEHFLGQAAALDPGNLAVRRNLAELAIARSQLGDARRLLSEARALASPDDSRFSFQLGRLYRETGSLDLALAAWSRVDPDLGAWSCSSTDLQLILWAAELLEQQRWESAARVSRAAIRLEPAYALPYRLLAMALDAEDPAAARAALGQLAGTRPDLPWAAAELSRLHQRVGQSGEADAWNREALAAGRLVLSNTRLGRVRPCEEFIQAQPAVKRLAGDL